MFNFKEFDNPSFDNPGTIASIVLLLITLFQARALGIQRDEIWKKESGKSISNPLFTYFIFYHLATLYYGIDMRSLTVIMTGLLFIYYYQIVKGLWKFERASSEARSIAIVSSTALYLFAVPIPIGFIYNGMVIGQTQLVYSAFTIMASLPLIHQAVKLYDSKKTGNLRPELMVAVAVKLLFWLVFARSANDPVFFYLTIPALVVVTGTMVLWCYYKKQENNLIAAQKAANFFSGMTY